MNYRQWNVKHGKLIFLIVLLYKLTSSGAYVTNIVRRNPYRIGNLRMTNNREPALITEQQQALLNSIATFKPLDNQETNNTNENDIWFSRLTLLCVSAFYGTNFGCVKVLDEALEPSVSATLRFGLASLVFLPFLFKAGATQPKTVIGGLEVGSFCALGYWAQAKALLTTSASTVAFICSLAVVVVPLLDMMFQSKSQQNNDRRFEPLPPALLAAAGVGCLELGGNSLPGIGDCWAFLQPLFFGLSFWRVETHMRDATEPGQAQVFTGAMMLAVASFSFVWSCHDFLWPLLKNSDDIAVALNSQLATFSDWRVPAAIAWTGIVTTALTSFGENVAMKRLSAAESTVIYSTEPLWGTAFAAVALGEQIGWNTGFGALLIISACVWSSMGPPVPLIAALSAMQTFLGEGVEEVGINVEGNWLEWISKWREGGEL